MSRMKSNWACSGKLVGLVEWKRLFRRSATLTFERRCRSQCHWSVCKYWRIKFGLEMDSRFRRYTLSLWRRGAWWYFWQVVQEDKFLEAIWAMKGQRWIFSGSCLWCLPAWVWWSFAWWPEPSLSCAQVKLALVANSMVELEVICLAPRMVAHFKRIALQFLRL